MARTLVWLGTAAGAIALTSLGFVVLVAGVAGGDIDGGYSTRDRITLGALAVGMLLLAAVLAGRCLTRRPWAAPGSQASR